MTLKSSVEVPRNRGVYVIDTCCQEALKVMEADFDPTRVPELNSRNRSVNVAPGWSARTQMLALYVPGEVVVTQFGLSSRRHVAALVPVFVSVADQAPA